MSNTYPDIDITKAGQTLTVRTTFDSGRRQWTTMIIDKSGALTGRKLGRFLSSVTVGQSTVVNSLAEDVNRTRENFRKVIDRSL